MNFSTTRRVTGAVALAFALTLAVSLALPSAGHAQAAALPPELVSVKAGLEKYQDPILAVHDGFLSTVACVEFPKGSSEGTMQYPPGAMGVHFINMGNVGPTLDPTKPQVLIYEPDGKKLKLVAAEWFMPAQLAGDSAPTIFGQKLGGPMEGHQPIMPPEMHHYDLHVWLWRTNPAGVYVPTNPNVKCDKDGYDIAGAAPNMVHAH